MKNKTLVTLFVANGIFVLSGSLLGPLYAIFVEKFAGFDTKVMAVSFSWAAFLISTTLFTFIISKLGDKVKRREQLLLAGFIVRALSWILYIFVGNIYSLIALQILLGLGEALGSPAFDTIFAEHLDNGQHVAEYSNWRLITNITTAIGTITGGFIVVGFGFQAIFMVMSVLAIVSSAIIILRTKNIFRSATST